MGKNIWNKLVDILDGAPAVRSPRLGDRQARVRGQSLVEMALISPILILMFAGLVEIGWLANTYLNLLDITRSGARYAATLNDDRSPMSWDNRASYVPNDNVDTPYEMPYMTGDIANEQYLRESARELWAEPIQGAAPVPPLSGPSATGCSSASIGFYTDVICRMILSMPPMRTREPVGFDPYNHVDDVIISAFSLELVDSAYSRVEARPLADSVPQLLVVGRYPTNANECQINGSGALDLVRDLRDPFDFNLNNKVDTTDADLVATDTSFYIYNSDFSELPGYDSNPATLEEAERQVGFQWYGNHEIPDTGCIGSEWKTDRLEALMNFVDPVTGQINFPITTTAERRVLPSQGVVLVEVYWEHEMLLQIPAFSPVFEAFERDGKPDLYLWALFPLPAVDPYIEFN